MDLQYNRPRARVPPRRSCSAPGFDSGFLSYGEDGDVSAGQLHLPQHCVVAGAAVPQNGEAATKFPTEYGGTLPFAAEVRSSSEVAAAQGSAYCVLKAPRRTYRGLAPLSGTLN